MGKHEFAHWAIGKHFQTSKAQTRIDRYFLLRSKCEDHVKHK